MVRVGAYPDLEAVVEVEAGTRRPGAERTPPGVVRPPRPANDEERVLALRALNVLDTPPEERFDRVTRLAQRLFQVPIVLVTLIDLNRQWFKSCIGIEIDETPRDVSFCTHAILRDEPMVIEDARRDPRFASNPFVTGEPYIRSYAGMPLRGPDGHKLGTLCLIDSEPRRFNAGDLATLDDLARIVENELGAVELNQALAVQRRTAEENARLYQEAQREIAERRRAEAELARALDALKEAMRELERLSTAKSDFVSIVSHEFRTALTSVLGFSELLREGQLSAADVSQFGELIGETARRLNRLINDLLDLDRIESGSMKLQTEPLSINDVVRRSVNLLQSALAHHPTRLDLDPSEPQVTADDDRLVQMVTNLLTNAVKYSPGGGAIEVSTLRDGDTVCLRVRDHGMGIPEQDLDRIFDRYTRVESRASQSILGTGLGLPIVRQIVEMHGGRVWAESALGRGSTFHVALPAAPGPPESA